jgi:NAD(P)-dependent dehydrogenase (short-subunit alcohol dehydrogenase family)
MQQEHSMSAAPVLSGKICMVTGGAQGLGWALTQALADAGARVFLCDIDQHHIDRATDERQALPFGQRISIDQCDVADRDQVRAWVDRVRGSTGRIDVLVNNAVFMTWEPFAETSAETLDRSVRVGLGGVLHATRAVLPEMIRARQGAIVNLGSVAGSMFIFGGYATYAAVKAGVEALSEMLRLECRHSGVHVLLVRAGMIGGTALLQSEPPPAFPWLVDWLPVPTPDRVARLVLRALVRRRRVLTVPRCYAPLRLAYTLFPGLCRQVAGWGVARRSLADLSWRYYPRAHA